MGTGPLTDLQADWARLSAGMGAVGRGCPGGPRVCRSMAQHEAPGGDGRVQGSDQSDEGWVNET